MKFRFFAAAALLLGLSVGCQQEELNSLPEIQISNKYVSIPQAGGSVSIDITTTAEWKVDTTKFPQWLTLNPMQGGAGEGKITLSAAATEETRSVDLKLLCAGKTQLLRVMQQAEVGEPEIITCKEAVDLIKAGTQGTKTYYVKGIVCALIDISVQYGNATFWMSDNGVFNESDGQNLQVYRSTWLNGGKITTGDEIAVGDEIVVSGCLVDYKGTPETQEKTTTVVSITKSLISIDTDEVEVPKEGCDTSIVVRYKGNGLEVKPQVDWISLAGINVGTDSTIVTLHVAANEGDVRTGKVVIKSSIPNQNSEKSVTFTQASGLDCYSLPYVEKFDAGLGAWEIENVKIAEGKSYVWTWDTHGYIKGSAGVKADAEAYVVSPLIDLTNVTDAHVSFEHVSRYFANVYEEQTLWASGDNGQTWEQLLIPFYSTGEDWNFVNSGNISLKAYIGKQLKLKFKYVSNANAYSTWEVKNLKVEEGSGTLTSIAEIAGMGYNKDVTSNFTATLKDAVVTYVNGSNAFIEDATGGLLLYKSGHGFVAGDKINGAVSGKITFYGGFAEATALDASAATLTKDAQIVPTEITIDKLLAGFNRYVSCNVIIKDVTLGAALVSNGNRNTTLTCGESTISAYAKVKTISLDANVTGALRCYPCYNNSVENKQVGIWDAAHFTPAN